MLNNCNIFSLCVMQFLTSAMKAMVKQFQSLGISSKLRHTLRKMFLCKVLVNVVIT